VRFAIKTVPEATTWQDQLDVWRAADQMELWESAWNFDHFYPIFPDHDHLRDPCLEGWTMLAAMAQATSRIRVGCQVTGMIYRHPAVLANMAATVDIISGGRLELGLGAGWNEEETAAYGIPLPPLKERFDRFDEGLEAIVGLLTQESTTLDGAYVHLTEARCEPKPVQRPHPPITIGGSGPTRTLRAVARWAQQWNCIAASPEDWLAKKAILQQRCDEVGRDISEITCSVNLRYGLGGDLAELVARASSYADVGVDLGVVTLPPPHDARMVEPLAKALAPLAS
jgi:F420-dependent oxidoreductase-like protein